MHPWRLLGAQVVLADVLQSVVLPAVDPAFCAALWAADAFNGTRQLCAGRYNGSADTCIGDSGGPLLALSSGEGGWNQVGPVVAIISYGEGCALPGEVLRPHVPHTAQPQRIRRPAPCAHPLRGASWEALLLGCCALLLQLT